MSNQQDYNKAVKEIYQNSPDRIERDQRLQSATRSGATGYYAGKIITGYITGYCIGILLGIWFVYHFIVAPILFPLYDAIVKGLH